MTNLLSYGSYAKRVHEKARDINIMCELEKLNISSSHDNATILHVTYPQMAFVI